MKWFLIVAYVIGALITYTIMVGFKPKSIKLVLVGCLLSILWFFVLLELISKAVNYYTFKLWRTMNGRQK